MKKKSLAMTYEQFLLELDKTVNHFKKEHPSFSVNWRFIKNGVGNSARIRMLVFGGADLDPITAVCKMLTGEQYLPCRYREATKRLGIDDILAEKLRDASDRIISDGEIARIRLDLEVACSLEHSQV